MNTTHHISNQAELERLIGRYFDGETTVQEEQTLREGLADCPWSSEVIDEARFTMGYFTAHRQELQRRMTRTNRRRIIGIAASITVLLAIGGFALWHQQQTDNMCIAYVNGQTINDDQAVMAIVENDLNNIANASQAMISQLSSLGEALEIENN